MSFYQVGDRVEVVGNPDGWKEGERGTVTHVAAGQRGLYPIDVRIDVDTTDRDYEEGDASDFPFALDEIQHIRNN
jgi:hypothetical protein